MNVSAQKIHDVIDEVMEIGFVVHELEKQLDALKNKMKSIESNLLELRRNILASIEEDKSDKAE